MSGVGAIGSGTAAANFQDTQIEEEIQEQQLLDALQQAAIQLAQQVSNQGNPSTSGGSSFSGAMH